MYINAPGSLLYEREGGWDRGKEVIGVAHGLPTHLALQISCCGHS